MTSTLTTTSSIAGIKVPDSKLARAVMNWCAIRKLRCCSIIPAASNYFGALAGKRHGLKFDPELL